jgi:drug/metabolite transporter (DMT)-like permease
MTGSLTPTQFLLLCGYALGMAGGQLLFKLASARFSGTAPIEERALSVLLSGYFFGAVGLYFALSVLWVWILSFTPLSRAYPFVALALALTAVFGGLLFEEPLSVRLLIGIGVVLAGLLLVAG